MERGDLFQPRVPHHFGQGLWFDVFRVPFNHHEPISVAVKIVSCSVVVKRKAVLLDEPDELGWLHVFIAFLFLIIHVILRKVKAFT